MLSSIRSFTKSVWASLSSYTYGLVYHFRRQLPGFETPSFQNLALSILSDPTAARALNLIVQTMSSVPLQVKRRTSDGYEVMQEHPVLDLLRRPHPRMNYGNFIRAYMLGMLSGGEVWIRSVSPDTGPNADVPRRLRLYQVSEFSGFKRAGGSGRFSGLIEGYKFASGMGSETYDLDEAHHIYKYNPSNPERGIPLLLSGWRDLNKQQAADSWNIGLARGGGRVSGIWRPQGLEPGEQIPQQRHAEVKQNLRAEEKSARQNGQSIVLSGSYDFEDNHTNPTDADLTEMQEASGRKIAISMGVDPALVGSKGSRTLSNLEQALKGLYMLTVLPELDDLLEEMNTWLMPKYGPDVKLTYDRDAIEALQEDMTQKYKRYIAARGGPILTLQEAREALGYSSEPKGDVLAPTSRQQPSVRFDHRSHMQALDQLLTGDNDVPTVYPSGDGQ